MSVYNVVILSVLGVAITAVIRDHRDATFAITAVFTTFCTTLTLCFVFLPKVRQTLFTTNRQFSYQIISRRGGGGGGIDVLGNLHEIQAMKIFQF